MLWGGFLMFLFPETEQRFSTIPKGVGRNTDKPLEKLIEKAGIGKMQFFGNGSNGPTAVFQHHFRLGDQGSVDPFFGMYVAHLLHHPAQITLSDTETVGIKVEGVLAFAMLVDQVDEPIEAFCGLSACTS